MSELSGTLNALWDGLRLSVVYWWAWLPIVLGVVAYKAWLESNRAQFISKIHWVMLELIPPAEVPYASPKAAENIFSGLHATYAGKPGTKWKAQFFLGKVPVWFSFEIISDGGETHFFIRCEDKQRNLVEALVFAQYPDAEIREVPDYVLNMPEKFDPAQFDAFGAELEFTKEHAYPIKSYLEFEEAGGKDEYQRLDPIAPLLETMSALRPGEHLWLQFLIRATGDDWTIDGKKIVDKLKGKKEKPRKPAFLWLFEIIDSLVGIAKEEKKEEKEAEFNLQKLTAAERKVLEQVEFKLAKLAFKTGIRVLYTANPESFNGARVPSVIGMFKQLYYTNMNTFKPSVLTKDKGILKWIFPSDIGFFAGGKILKKKKKMYEAYRRRMFPRNKGKEMFCILNTEELATLWHLPGLNVKAPLMPRVQAKKGQPPAILPTRPHA